MKNFRTKRPYAPKRVSSKGLKRNSRRFNAGAFLILIPLAAAIVALYYVFGSGLISAISNNGNSRLVTEGWQDAESSLASAQPTYEPRFAYYKLQEGQNIDWLANHFSVDATKLQTINPGNNIQGTTVKITPVEHPLVALQPSQITNDTSNVYITESQGALVLNNRFTAPEINLTVPLLMRILAQYDGISQLGPKTYLLNKPLYISNNIRVDITSDTVDTLYLKSNKDYDITTLTFQNSEALIKGVTIQSYDTTTKKPDADYHDGRAFLRAYESGRMDVIDSDISYLGMSLEQIQNPDVVAKVPFVAQGGVYGASWRIGTGSFGSDIATGWVQNSTFEKNYIGAFTFGASGMMWRDSLFTGNTVYGLDPHDDSNNATIEYNRFVANGKHGFIVSKRCDYNIIRNNVSIDNALHGYMLHENSDYNVIEGNIAIGNYDNFVFYASNFDTIKNNLGINPRGSQVRINAASTQSYVQENQFYGGKKGIYLYGNADGVEVKDNVFQGTSQLLTTNGAKRVYYGANISDLIGYDIGSGDRVVFGVNSIKKSAIGTPTPLKTYDDGKSNGTSIKDTSLRILNEAYKH